MIVYDFVIRGFICSRTTSPVPFFSYITSAFAWIRLLLCKGKFPAFFLAGSGKFSTD